jgi:hypothetical protein
MFKNILRKFYRNLYLFIFDLKLLFKDFKPKTLPQAKDYHKTDTETAVIMCTWKRTYFLNKTLAMLANQDSKIDFFIWNNNSMEIEKINTIIKDCTQILVQIFHSKNNVGGFGRFYLAKLALKLGYKKIVFIDDDQIMENNFVSTLLKELKPKTIITSFGFQFDRNFEKLEYWEKFMSKAGEECEYAGTGGMILEASVFEFPEIFECPKKYWFIEDLWLNYIAKQKYQIKLIQSSLVFQGEEDNLNQSQNKYMKYKKIKFLDYLESQGYLQF